MSSGAHHEPLSAIDASFLRIETGHEPQHVGSLSVFDGAPLRDPTGRIRIEELRDHVDRRIHRVPRLRQRVATVPFDQGPPVWIDDQHFDINYHVRLTALPKPGDEQQLCELMSRLQSLPLDRRRPLWEMWFVDGIAGDDVGLIIKTHHALGDGIANVDLALALVDLEPTPPSDVEPAAWRPRPAPSDTELLVDGLLKQATQPLRVGAQMMRAATRPVESAKTVAGVLETVVRFLRRPPDAPWNKDVSPHRRWVNATVDLNTVRSIGKATGTTVNDVVLAACTAALRSYLHDHHDVIPDRPFQAMVPISQRGDDEHGDTLGNLITLVLVDLPVAEVDPLRRLEQIHASTSALKSSEIRNGARHIIELAGGIPPIATPLTRFVSRQIPMNLVITNIPGPPIPLYLCGGRLRRTFPYVEVIDHEGLTIAVVSYDDQLFFGLTSDRDVITDLGDLAEAIEKAVVELSDRSTVR